jgi:hypothetical protein
MWSTKIPIRVAVIFSPGGKITPKWFEMDHRKHEIREITFHWRDKVGDTTLLIYSVTDGEALYELVYNTRDQTWCMRALQVEGF